MEDGGWEDFYSLGQILSRRFHNFDCNFEDFFRIFSRTAPPLPPLPPCTVKMSSQAYFQCSSEAALRPSHRAAWWHRSWTHHADLPMFCLPPWEKNSLLPGTSIMDIYTRWNNMTKDVFFTFQATVCLKGRNQWRPSGRMRAGMCVDFTEGKQGREDQWGKSDSKESEPPAAAFTSQTFLHSSVTPWKRPTDKDTTEGGNLSSVSAHFLGFKTMNLVWVLIRARRNSLSCKTTKVLYSNVAWKKATYISQIVQAPLHI